MITQCNPLVYACYAGQFVSYFSSKRIRGSTLEFTIHSFSIQNSIEMSTKKPQVLIQWFLSSHFKIGENEFEFQVFISLQTQTLTLGTGVLCDRAKRAKNRALWGPSRSC